MDKTDTPESNDNGAETARNPLDHMTELATIAASHSQVAPPLRELVPALVALVIDQQAVIAELKG